MTISMNAKNDVVIVSAFGRGNWLASRLAVEGMKVVLVDVSEHMGFWTPEDWEGPFGFFRSERLQQSQLERLIEDDPEESVDTGFTVWLKSGPIEMKGPLADFSLDTLGASKTAQGYLLRYDSLSADQRKLLQKDLVKIDFAKAWIAHLAHQFSTNALSIEKSSFSLTGEPLPIFAPFYFRRVSRHGLRRGLDLLENKGVKVFSPAKVVDIAIAKGTVEGIEIESDFSGVLFANNFLWMLSSEESERLGENVRAKFFPQGWLEPDWFWMRFGLDIENAVPPPFLPNHFLVIEDLNLTWTHENLLCCQKSVKEGLLDVWARIPTRQRFHRTYMEDIVDRACKLLSARLSLPVKCVRMPQDYLYDQSQIGPARFPVFSPNKLARFAPHEYENCYYDSPETWGGLDWHSQFRSQAMIAQKLINVHRPRHSDLAEVRVD